MVRIELRFSSFVLIISGMLCWFIAVLSCFNFDRHAASRSSLMLHLFSYYRSLSYPRFVYLVMNYIYSAKWSILYDLYSRSFYFCLDLGV